MVHTDVIFVIEDNPDDIYLVKEGFRQLDMAHQLKFFKRGNQALEFLRKGDRLPSIVLLDLNLPDKDGREILVEIKQDPILRKIPVIIFSTSDSPNDVAFCMSNYANSYVVKPLEFMDLVEALRILLAYWLDVNFQPTPI